MIVELIAALPDPWTVIADDADLSLPPGGTELAVEGKRIGQIVEILGIEDDGRALRLLAELDKGNEPFVDVVTMGLVEGVRIP